MSYEENLLKESNFNNLSLDLTPQYDPFKERINRSYIQPTHLKNLKSSVVEIWGTERYGIPYLAGYNPRNGGFDIEYDNNAEQIVCLASQLYDFDVKCREENTKEEHKLIQKLQITLGRIYNSRLQERALRKKMLRDYGLMNLKGTRLWVSRLEVAHGIDKAKRLIRLARLMTADEAELLHAKLECVSEIRCKLNKLIFYRAQYGISSNWELEVFEKLKKLRTPKSERLDLRSVLMPDYIKKKKDPMEVFHLPRFSELTPQEAELCSSLFVVPEFLLTTKESLLAECKKTNGLTLKRARKMVRIDVNKTRKIYDLFMEQGVIWPPVDVSTGGYAFWGKKKKL